MADDTSGDEYVDSEDASERTSSAGEVPSAPSKIYKTEPTSGDEEPALRKRVSQPRRIVHEPGSYVPSSNGQAGVRRKRSQSSQPRQKVESSDYQDIFDNMASEDDHFLSESQLGASFWTSREKATLFRALQRHDPSDILGLARAVGTKSEYEVLSYLTLLQKALVNQKPSPTQEDDIPAAFEISERCTSALEAMADIESARSYEHEVLSEHAKYGDDFLVDEEAADREDLLYEQREATQYADEPEMSAGENADSVSKPPTPPEIAKSDSTSLLRLPILLQLMRNIFMNNGEQDSLNWHHIEPVIEDSSEPAIYRSALGDFTTIVVNLTRRLVQATIFQSMTRLRAADSSRREWTPLAAVREVDVRQAVDLLNMEPRWHQYWMHVAKRNHLAVYSESKKYKDGRAGTKNGYRLTDDEIRLELGDEPISMSELDAGEDFDVLEENIKDVMDDSDLFTDEETASAYDLGTDHESGEETDSSKPKSKKRKSRKRKRSLSPDAFARAEDSYLEALDQNQSVEEELHLWNTLGLEPPQELEDFTPAKLEKSALRAGPDKPKPWREMVEYADDWEHGSGVPNSQAFQVMELEGQKGRERRKAVAHLVHKRLEGYAKAETDRDDEVNYTDGDSHSDDEQIGGSGNEGSGGSADDSDDDMSGQGDSDSEN